MSTGKTPRGAVLFVCLGNICRSPAGEGVLKKLVTDRGLRDRVRVDSAGTIGYHAGSPADARMRRVASQRGYRLDGRARQFTSADFERFDLIVAMDSDNLDDLREQATLPHHHAKLRLLSDFLPADASRDVPDPYYGGVEGFEEVLDMVEQACDGILGELLR